VFSIDFLQLIWRAQRTNMQFTNSLFFKLRKHLKNT